MINTNLKILVVLMLQIIKSTASDLLKLTEYSIKNSTFNNIVKKESYSFKAINTKDLTLHILVINFFQKREIYDWS